MYLLSENSSPSSPHLRDGRIALRSCQLQVYESPARFRVLAAGRRFGKTYLAMVELLRAASHHGRLAWYVAPSYRMAKRIAWQRLKDITRPYWLEKPNETDLSIRLTWRSTVALRGADRPDSLRGNGLDFVVLDEFASMRPECWSEVIRPALSDRQGSALFLGTPQGCNHFYDRFEQAKTDAAWAAFQFSTIDGSNVSQEELLSASHQLDPACFRQEFEASFEGAGLHRVYYAFSLANVKPVSYDKTKPLIWTLDFNVDPMCMLLIQRHADDIHVIEELIVNNANTESACETFLKRTRDLLDRGTIKVEVYGDSSGHQRRTSGTATDWSIIRTFFSLWQGNFIPNIRATPANPGVRDRVNCVNARLLNAAGENRLFVDPKCRELIRDLEQVSWALDSSGRPTSELDKSDRRRTHVSDALGYYVAAAFAMRPRIGEKQGPLF